MPMQCCRWRFAELCPIGVRHSAEVSKAEIEGDIGNALIARRACQPGIEMGKTDVDQHLRDRCLEMSSESELQRTDADAGDFGKLREIERLGGAGMQIFAGSPERARQRFGTAAKCLDLIAQIVTRTMKQAVQQRLPEVGHHDRRKPPRSRTFGNLDDIQDLRAQPPSAGIAKIDRRRKLDRANRLA